MKSIIGKFNIFLLTEARRSLNTVLAYIRDVDQFADFCQEHHYALKDISIDVVKKFLSYLHNKRISPRSRARKIASLRAFFLYAFPHKVSILKKISMPQFEPPLPRYLSEIEIEKLFTLMHTNYSVHSPRNHLIIYILYCTGIRVSELIKIQIADIDFNSRFLKVMGKGGKERMVPLPYVLIDVIQKYLDSYHKEFVATHRKTLYLFPVMYRGTIAHITRQTVLRALKNLWHKVGINKTISPHQLRHSFASHLLKNGANLRQLQTLLGHERISSTQIYAHVDMTNARNVYDKKHPRA